MNATNSLFGIITKPVYFTILYYIIALSAITMFNILPGFKSGPCTPNLDILSAFMAFVGVVILLVANVIKLKQKGRMYLSSVLIHLFVLLTCIIYLVITGSK